MEVERPVRRLIQKPGQKMMVTLTRNVVKALKSGCIVHRYFEGSTKIFAHREGVVQNRGRG